MLPGGVRVGSAEAGASPSEDGEHPEGQVPRGPFPGRLPGFLVQLCPLGPQKPFPSWLGARPGQVLGVLSKSPQVRSPPQPLPPPRATLQNDREPVDIRELELLLGY